MKNVFNPADTATLISRINKLTLYTQRLQGKMTVSQMLAHCNVSYEFVYDDIHPKPNAFKKLLPRLLVKRFVVGEKPYKRNSQTAPEFIVKENKNFEGEKNRLIAYIKKTQELGAAHLEHKDSHSFSPLTNQEWNNLFYKHLDHHLSQFGV